MESLLSLMIGAFVTLVFVGLYWRQMTPSARSPLRQASKRTTEVEVPAGVGGRPMPVINASLCIGCGSCVSACPEDGALAMVGGKAVLQSPDRCSGAGKCVEACPTQGIVLAMGGVAQTMRLPHVGDNFETNIPGVFIIGELGGVGLIKNAINEGKTVIDELRRQLRVNTAPTADESYDVIIVGTGPGGLSASLAAHQAGLRYLTLEQGEVASTIRNYPRQKLVFAEPLEMPLYGKLFMVDGASKEQLLKAWETIIETTGVRIQTKTRVEGVTPQGGMLHVQTSQGDYVSRGVVLATGRRGSPRKLNVPGEDLPKVAYRLVEADSYQGEDILVVGGGDSALECALALARSGRNRVTISYRGEALQRPKQRNQLQLATAESERRISLLTKSKVLAIEPRSVTLDHDGKRVELPNSYVFVLAGGESPEAFLTKIGIEIEERSISLAQVTERVRKLSA